MVANLLGGGELPLLLAVESGNGDAARNVDALSQGRNLFKGSLDSIVDTVEKTGAELDGQRLAGSDNGIADLDTSCSFLSVIVAGTRGRENGCVRTGLFVDLDTRLVARNSNDLTDEVLVSYFDLEGDV